MLFKKSDPRYSFIRDKLIKARKEKGIRQSDLAKELGVRQQFISKIETAERGIDFLEMVQISKALELDINALISNIRDESISSTL
ncbi:helix-turn-helix transcriptional regulator [Temperatibacter marinus]|uniref:Helix-turn-helix transcriptional regulator n=1 Tax=Temperatibacter marinus TaxID=1456591 RepID=A0AA52EIK2_9PROT|nr:helix-turn-helix transcriptional regulator [Temperatibacter marinus]WND03460.1 helix-turn-helix transcriptional regulator [Temperatibacter marinus]